MLTVPLTAAALVTVNVSPSLSESLANTSMLVLLFSFTLALSFTATGASLVAMTVMLTRAVFEIPPSLSLTV